MNKNKFLLVSLITLLIAACQEGPENCGFFPVSDLSFVVHYDDGAVTSQLFSAPAGTGSQQAYHVDSVRLMGNSGQILAMDAAFDQNRGEWVFSTIQHHLKDGDFGGSGDGTHVQRLILSLKHDRRDTLDFSYEARKPKRSDGPCPPREFEAASYDFDGIHISDQLTFYPFLELVIRD